jgi:Asp-tRNA(Asn)/Glu-tRNA(Gln) amidotransferase A subunit family amidase
MPVDAVAQFLATQSAGAAADMQKVMNIAREQAQSFNVDAVTQYLASTDMQKVATFTNLAACLSKTPSSLYEVRELASAAVNAFWASPDVFMRTVGVAVITRVPWYVAIPVAVVSSVAFIASLKVFWRLAFAGYNWAMWNITAGSRNRRIAKVRAERTAEQQRFVAWASSSASGGGAPTLEQRMEVATLTIPQLRDRYRTGTLTPTFVLKCYVLNAAEAQDRTNCVANFRVEDAIADAARADQLYAQHIAAAKGGKSLSDDLPPLLGIPLSFKECVTVKGTYSTAGCYDYLKKGRATERGTMAASLIAQGAVVFVTTTIPQTMLAFDCASRIWGATGNAHDPTRSPGGSSGGEGALVAAYGSAAGITTDVGGSTRIPAAWNGIYGLKPSLWRCPNYGGMTPIPGQEAVSSTPGPAARTLEDVMELFKCMVSQEAGTGCTIDGTINYVPWREDLYQRYRTKPRLRIGVSLDDGWTTLAPACRRAVQETAEALRRAGHDVVEFTHPNAVPVMNLFYSYIAGGFPTLAQRFDGASEPPMKAVALTYLMARVLPMFVFNRIVPFFLRVTGASELLANGLSNIKVQEVYEFISCFAQRNALRTEYARACWGGTNSFDCVICPAMCVPAPLKGSVDDKSWAVSYTGAYNVLDTSSMVVPVTSVDATKDVWPEVTGSTAKPQPCLMDRKLRSIYDSNAPMPVGVQIVGPRSSEERVLGCAAVICDVIKARSPVPPHLKGKVPQKLALYA